VPIAFSSPKNRQMPPIHKNLRGCELSKNFKMKLNAKKQRPVTRNKPVQENCLISFSSIGMILTKIIDIFFGV